MKRRTSSHTTKRKCSYEKKQTTLDACHQQQVVAFKERYAHLEAHLHELQAAFDTTLDDDNEDDRNDLAHQITSCKEDMLACAQEEVEYYTKTTDILYYYYDAVEQPTSTAIVSSPGATHTSPISKPIPKKVSSSGGGKSILDFLTPRGGGGETLEPTALSTSQSTPGSPNQTLVLSSSPPPCALSSSFPEAKNTKATLYEKYLHCTDKDYVKSTEEVDTSTCEYCGSPDQVVLLQDGMMYCNHCYTVTYIVVDNEKPSYKEPQKEISYLNYKRRNHFNEWLNQIQGKETTEIPEDIFNAILLEIKKLKITNMAEINHAKIREILKKLRFNKYYEHTPYIYYRITGIPNQYLSPELEEKLRNMFEQIQAPFNRHSPKNRKNFLSYSYAIHKLLLLLGEDKYLPYFPLLKNREKLHQQEQVWAKICEDLNWTFYRSI